jgi:hypothetical protein
MSGDAAVAAALRDIQASPLRPSSRSLGTISKRLAWHPVDACFAAKQCVASCAGASETSFAALARIRLLVERR